MNDKMRTWINEQISEALREKQDKKNEAQEHRDNANYYAEQAAKAEAAIQELEDRVSYLIGLLGGAHE